MYPMYPLNHSFMVMIMCQCQCATHLEVVCLVVASSAGVLKLEHRFELILLLLVIIGEDGAVVKTLQC